MGVILFLLFYITSLYLIFGIGFLNAAYFKYCIILSTNYFGISILYNLYIYIIFMFLLCLIGIILNYKNFFLNIIFIELGFLCINYIFLITFFYINIIECQIIVIYILTFMALETAIGLALFLVYYNNFFIIFFFNSYDTKRNLYSNRR